MKLDAVEFLRRFVLHSLPKGFQRIRQFGFLSNRHRGTAIERGRALIHERHDGGSDAAVDSMSASCVLKQPTDSRCCMACGSHRVLLFDMPARRAELLVPRPHFRKRLRRVTLDSS